LLLTLGCDSPERLEIPSPRLLTRLLPLGTASHSHIFQTGQVSTRKESRHDLFNALVWSRLPGIKSALNALHIRYMSEQIGDNQTGNVALVEKRDRETGVPVQRGPGRDALTLIDESGVIVVGSDCGFLADLASRSWQEVFVSKALHWQGHVRVLVTGHGLLEKLLRPYKALTAHALLVRVSEKCMRMTGEELTDSIDREISRLLLAGSTLSSTDCLSPLPLMGIPGWWPLGEQDSAFYADTGVFRPPPAGFTSPPIYQLHGTAGGQI
jgi:hypothetical protein